MTVQFLDKHELLVDCGSLVANGNGLLIWWIAMFDIHPRWDELANSCWTSKVGGTTKKLFGMNDEMANENFVG